MVPVPETPPPVRAGHDVPVDAESWAAVSEAIAAGDEHYVASVVHDGGTIALVRNSWSDGWVLPGGGVEAGESLEAAAVREVTEETGLRVDLGRPVARIEQRFVYGGDSARGRLTVFDAPARTTALGSDLGVTPDEIREAAWFESVPDRVDGLPASLFERVVGAAEVDLS